MNKYCITQVDRLPVNTEGASWILEGIDSQGHCNSFRL